MPIPTPYAAPDPPPRPTAACPSPSPASQESCADLSGDDRRPPLPTLDTHKPALLDRQSPQTPSHGRISPTETRQQLIQRVKKEQREHRPFWLADAVDLDCGTQAREGSRAQPTLLSSPLFEEHWPASASPVSTLPQEFASSLERPRSALHRGDFHRHGTRDVQPEPHPTLGPPAPSLNENQWLGSSPPAPWLTRPDFAAAVPQVRPLPLAISLDTRVDPIPVQHRPRAISHSLASSFAFRAPTSPLANQSNSTDLDTLDEAYEERRSQSPDRSSRRRTFSPSALRNLHRSSGGYGYDADSNRPLSSVRRHGTCPYQAHQPRRSIASYSEASSLGIIHTPSAHSRRPSLASETSPLQQLPMVGRYEESILRGRMSSLPSKPVEFLAQIGVLGRGNCKASLRCPPHVSVPFPAVFYNYGSKPGLSSLEGPSPYVGRIELDKHLKTKPKTKARRRDAASLADQSATGPMEIDMQAPAKKKSRRPPSDSSSKEVPDGTYRIPEKGQIQVIVKNPNKTAVKLFLIPYDLIGMEPGQKTWIRQRSYTSGPILDNALTSNPESTTRQLDATHRPVLRYLIHIHICCLAKGRHYLYKEIRIVFANRVPDGKEKLRQEITLPEPRFSVYRPDPRNQSTKAAGTGHAQEASRAEARPQLGTPMGSEISTGGRPNFAWESFAPTDPGPQLFKSLPLGTFAGLVSPDAPPSAHAGNDDDDVEMSEAPPASPSDRVMRQRDSSRASSMTKSPPLNPVLFERLSRDQWSPNGAPPRVKSPAPGEGLISQQHRTWAERHGGSDDSL